MVLQNTKRAISVKYYSGIAFILAIAFLIVVPVSANNGSSTHSGENGEEYAMLDPDIILTLSEEEIEEACGIEIGQKYLATGTGGWNSSRAAADIEKFLDLNLIVTMVTESTKDPCRGTLVVEDQICLASGVPGAVVTGFFSELGDYDTKTIGEGCTTVDSVEYDMSLAGSIRTIKRHPDIRNDVGVHSWFDVAFFAPHDPGTCTYLVQGVPHAYLLVEENT